MLAFAAKLKDRNNN